MFSSTSSERHLTDLLADVRRLFALCVQHDVAPELREEIGLHAVFRDAFPFDLGRAELVYVSYAVERPRLDAEACLRRSMTWAAPLKLTVQLVIYDDDRTIRDVKEQEIYFGEIPLMTEEGTFIVNGEERVLESASELLTHAFAEGVAGTFAEMGQLRRGMIETLMPHDLIYAKAFTVAIRTLLARAPLVRGRNPVTQIEHVRGEPCAELLAPFACDAERVREAFARARMLVDPHTAAVEAGTEGDFARAAGLVQLSGVDGRLHVLSTSAVVIVPSNPSGAAFVLEPRRWYPSARRVVDRLVRSNGAVYAKDVVFECDGAREGRLALGRNAQVRFDASAKDVVVSEAFAHAMRASEVFVAEARCKDTRMGKQARRAGPGLDESGIVPLGALVDEGDLLVGIDTPETGKRDPSLRVKRGMGGRVVRVDVLARRGVERCARHQAILAEQEKTWDEVGRTAKEQSDARWQELFASHEPSRRGDDLAPGVIEVVRVTIEREVPLEPDALVADRCGNVFTISRVERGLDVDVVLPGHPTDGARAELEAGGLYLMHLSTRP